MKLSIMKPVVFIITYLSLLSCTNSQDNSHANYNPRLVDGPCDGCEAVFEFGDRVLSPVDTLPDFDMAEQKLKVTGYIYQSDGKTPASDVILYIYQTNQGGIYATKGDETGWGRRHGYIRGWIKTGKDGKYTFYTLKPGSYPSRTEPAHIHPTILEPDGKYYWLGAYLFEGDSLLTSDHLYEESPRGGSQGVVSLRKEGDFYVAERDFILGQNISGYK